MELVIPATQQTADRTADRQVSWRRIESYAGQPESFRYPDHRRRPVSESVF